MTDIQLCNARVMIGNLPLVCCPCVDVNMLKLCSSGQGPADKHVVQLLAIHVKQIRVPLQLTDPSHVIHVLQSGPGFECLQGLYVYEFVEVTARNDGSVGIFPEDLRNEILCMLEPSYFCEAGKGTYSSQGSLRLTIFNAAIDWWSRIPLDG